LIGMRERVDLLNGELTIDSKIGFGTVILIRVPLP
jgi:two-component system, NarL family, sensor histidine kinase DegS